MPVILALCAEVDSTVALAGLQQQHKQLRQFWPNVVTASPLAPIKLLVGKAAQTRGRKRWREP
ncbi:hypothetical protein [Mycobacterium sp.]|uniref:hypothetical protein n=1 Tax=Mycobacterium sp. TaxID=1785 RepID=UPI003C7895D2